MIDSDDWFVGFFNFFFAIISKCIFFFVNIFNQNNHNINHVKKEQSYYSAHYKGHCHWLPIILVELQVWKLENS